LKIEVESDVRYHARTVLIELSTAEVTALLEDGQVGGQKAGDIHTPLLNITIREVTPEMQREREAAKKLPPIEFTINSDIKTYHGYDFVSNDKLDPGHILFSDENGGGSLTAEMVTTAVASLRAGLETPSTPVLLLPPDALPERRASRGAQ
jgi:hypothetical protein